eukprot:TCONS_00001639-protein
MSLPGGSATATMSAQMAQASLEKDFDFPQLVFDMISAVESSKEPKDELLKKVVLFKQKMNQCKELLKKMPGLDQSPEEQLRSLKQYQEELEKKKEALEKLKYLDVFTSAAVKKEP